MYESKTYESILADALAEVQSDVLKTEGSLVYNAVSALAFELEKIYIQLDFILNQMDPNTADFENLQKLAAQRAVYPAEATHAVVKIQANVPLPVGARFSLSAFNYAVTERLGDESSFTYAAMCEEAGADPNGLIGDLIPITYVDGLQSATITELLVAGSDADGREELYDKYIKSFTSLSFGGNVAAYKEKLTSMDGIGGCKVYPVWNGYGTVKLVLQGSDYGAVSEYLLQQVQHEICPEPGKGYGFAPVNHDVTCASVEGLTINVRTSITFSAGYSWAVCQEEIKAAIENYLLSIRKAWGEGGEDDYAMVYISRLESAVLDVQGVVDIQNTKLNGSGSNMALRSDQVPVMGEVTIA